MSKFCEVLPFRLSCEFICFTIGVHLAALLFTDIELDAPVLEDPFRYKFSSSAFIFVLLEFSVGAPDDILPRDLAVLPTLNKVGG